MVQFYYLQSIKYTATTDQCTDITESQILYICSVAWFGVVVGTTSTYTTGLLLGAHQPTTTNYASALPFAWLL